MPEAAMARLVAPIRGFRRFGRFLGAERIDETAIGEPLLRDRVTLQPPSGVCLRSAGPRLHRPDDVFPTGLFFLVQSFCRRRSDHA